MASDFKNLSEYDKDFIPDGSNYSVAIVVSDYHSDITFKLRDACRNALMAHGVAAENIVVKYAPGAFELPFVAQQCYMTFDVDAVIALGCVIKGDTDHDVYINQTIASALMNMTIDYETPFIFGVLTVNTPQQAEDRAGGKHGNKGVECAIAALKTIALKEELSEDDDEAYLN